MNETDVREEIVRPLITRLGYKHGADAYVRTEMTLSYSFAFLGRKNPKKDPILTGRADYICGVVAAGQWVIEVKGPGEELTAAVVQQAHTYAAHPEIAAFYFVVTNGKTFRVYETGRLSVPLLEWSVADQDGNFLRILNLLGPEAIRKRARFVLADPADPLGEGLSSKLRIIGGSVYYDSQEAGQLSTLMAGLVGLELPVTGGEVIRDSDGRIHAKVSIASVAPLMRSLGAVGLADCYDFYSSSRYISTDAQIPTIFQNLAEKRTGQGTPVSYMGKQTAMPFGMAQSAFTEVVGYVDGDQFHGTMRIETDLKIDQMNPMLRAILQNQFGIIPGQHRITQSGRFRAQLASAI